MSSRHVWTIPSTVDSYRRGRHKHRLPFIKQQLSLWFILPLLVRDEMRILLMSQPPWLRCPRNLYICQYAWTSCHWFRVVCRARHVLDKDHGKSYLCEYARDALVSLMRHRERCAAGSRLVTSIRSVNLTIAGTEGVGDTRSLLRQSLVLFPIYWQSKYQVS